MRYRLLVERRTEDVPAWMPFATALGSVVLAFLVSGFILSLIGGDPIRTLTFFYNATFGSWPVISDTVVKATPLIMIGLACSIAFKMKLWNIGAEGQYVVGAIAGTGVGLLTNTMTGPWIFPLMLIAGMAGGAAYAAIPAFLRTQFKVNEILTTLMLSYVSVQLLNYLVFGPWKSPTSMGQPQTVLFSADQSQPYIIPGTIFLIAFQVVPVVSTFGVSFTNFGDGHRGTKEDAIAAIEGASVKQVPGSAEYVLTIATEALHPVEEAVGLYGLSQMLLAVAVLMVLIFRPKGLFGMAEPDLLGWIGKSHGRQPTRSGSKCHREV